MADGDRQYRKSRGFLRLVGDETNPTFGIAVDSDSKALHFFDPADALTDWDVTAYTHPTLLIHSTTTPATNYFKMYHDGTTGYLSVGGTTGRISVDATWSVAGETGRPFVSNLTISDNLLLGGWANALKGYVVCGTNAGTAGLLSAVNCEILMPPTTCRGAYYPLEVEYVDQSSTSFGAPGSGSQAGFIYLGASGTVTDFNADGVFMSINGLTGGSGSLLSADTQTLRVDFGNGTTTRYLVMSQTENIVHTNVATIANDGRIMKLEGTWATPSTADGYGLIEVDISITGTSGVSASLSSMWANLGGASQITQYLTLRNDGFYDAGATLTNAEISMQKYHCNLASNPTLLTIWDLNFVHGTYDVIDAIFEVNNPATTLGYVAGGATDGGGIGTIPFLITSGTRMYIHLYNDRT